ncbi:MAG: hypothetical protein EAZ53_04880 [Bacteroidetes bacterium]|nr:MAG: hypothetical protein EAZ53_04880 [Bacteroidota bacterium]
MGYVFIHKNADLNDIELNKRIAILLAKENGDSVIIREHFKKGKNPELLVNNILSDVKTPTKLSSINTAFSNAQKQNIKTFVCELTLNFSLKDLIEGVSKGFKFNKAIDSVKLVKSKVVVEITRKMYESEEYIKYLKKLQ